ncbi:MAG: hypothetical protein B6241_12385 [Spirochaetaceae bacterium 4572_59]|nr:MAG: hypothetical protein B6241_12385 [Spirochaetaceae bacterium 4572_59]
MGKKSVLECPEEMTPADSHILYLINGLTDRKVTLKKLRDYMIKSLPVGTVWMYDGSDWQDDVDLPGFYACTAENASRGCPDMTGRFVMGKAADAEGELGGANSLILTEANLPSHTHAIDHDHGAFNSASGGVAHTHSINHDHGSVTSSSDSHYHIHGVNFASSGTPNMLHGYTTSTSKSTTSEFQGTAGGYYPKSSTDSHSHSVNLPNYGGTSGGASAYSHSHPIDIPAFTGDSGATGDGSPIDNRPAFYSMIFIKKCA